MFIRNGPLVSKSRSTPVVVNLPPSEERLISDNSLLSTFGGGPFTTQTLTESINYACQPPGSRGKANNCIHKRSRQNFNYVGPLKVLHHTAASPTKYSLDNAYPGWSASAHGLSVTAANTALGVPLGTSLLGANALTYINDGFSRMRPDLTELSVPNFLLEIDDIKSLLNLWSSRRPLLQNVANAFLNYNFGWKPTIGDLGAMVSAVVGFREKIKQWNNSLGQLKSKRVTILSDSISKSGQINGQPYATFTTSWRGSVTRTVTAHIQYRPCPIKAMTNLERELRGLLDALGFELNPAILWEAIPFSFVVDWFIGVGRYLEGLKLDTLELPIKLENSYLQYKQLASYESFILDNGDSIYPKRLYPGATSSEVLFHRMCILPRTEDLMALGWRLPNLKQWALGLALGITRSK